MQVQSTESAGLRCDPGIFISNKFPYIADACWSREITLRTMPLESLSYDDGNLKPPVTNSHAMWIKSAHFF